MQIRFQRLLRSFPLLVSLVHGVALGQSDLLVRTTEPQSAAEELKGFKVPQGFKVQLFADESMLGGKPINMAFDARGRLWVSSTREYPYAVPKEKWSPDTMSAPGSKDSIRILEDTDGDGRADKMTVFADNLNIPTGVVPYKNGCIAWSIPNLLYLEDTDQDGKADKRSIILGPLGYELDTHGMISSLRLGLDGWIYATHGFNNTSVVRPRDGSVLNLQSGNTFRFKPDGSRAERWTHGQVNPFGMCWDSRGNLYSADCHSSPIYQLIRGAFYPSFGKPHDGLGYAPVMCRHSHGSTGIAGVVYIDGGIWGPEWDDRMFIGNPITSKVNQDFITFTGTTPGAKEETDFITSTDPWFRPVDLTLGPDSALYVADFYNRIIGHYEVPLDHPGRDRSRGRIWRVVKEGHTGRLTDSNLAKLGGPALMLELSSPNITRRYLATEELVSRIGKPALALARSQITGKTKAPTAADISDYADAEIDENAIGIEDMHALWVAFRLGDRALPFRAARALMNSGQALEGHKEALSVACIQAMAEKLELMPEGQDHEGDPMVLDMQFDSRGAFSMRAAALTTVQHPKAHAQVPMLARPLPMEGHPERHLILESGDEALILTWRMAVRAWLSLPGSFARLPERSDDPLSRRHWEDIAFIACSVPTEEAAEWLLTYVDETGGQVPDLPDKLRHIARHAGALHSADLIKLVREHTDEDLDSQLKFHEVLTSGLQKEGTTPDPALSAWSEALTGQLLEILQRQAASSWHLTTSPSSANPNPWHTLARACADGVTRTMLDSHPPGGERLTGTFRSAAFEVPDIMEFWLAGHSGFPTAAPHGKNHVRLVDASTGEELARATPPRHDVAQKVVWKFAESSAGKVPAGMLPRGSGKAHLELVDGDNANAYAWLAVGGFEPELPALALPENAELRDERVRALARLGMFQSRTTALALAYLKALPKKASYTAATRTELAQRLGAETESPLAKLLLTQAADSELATTVFAVLEDPPSAVSSVRGAFQNVPFRTQVKLATALAGNAEVAQTLLSIAPARVLADPLVSGKIKALEMPLLTRSLEETTAKLPPANEAAKSMIAARMKSFSTAKTDEARGQEIYQVSCAICHRIGVRGNLVGPQLDGIGVRGVERLLEDVLDPNRAVDPAFRLHFVKQKNGTLITGLFRREQDGILYFADAAGQEHAVPRKDLVEDQVSDFSLMPAGFGDLLSEKDLHDLLAYLLARK